MRFLAILIPLSMTAQTPAHQSAEEFEQAHKPLVQPAKPKSREAASVTAGVAAKLPARGAAERVAHRNFIDKHIFGRMAANRIPHAPLSADEEFARRAWIDATGRIPPPAELAAFVAEKSPDKRAKLIETLLASDAFIDKWTYYFEDLFRAGGRMGPGLNLFHFWTREWLKLDRPYNEVVTDMLTGAGKSSFTVPAALYYQRDFVKAKDDPEAPDAHDLVNQPDTVDEFTVTYSKVFLGLNLACISCHDGAGHLEKVNTFLVTKKREDFFRQAAFFGKTRQIMNWENGYQANTEYTVDDEAPGYERGAESIVRVPRRGKGVAPPAFLLTGEQPKAGEHARDALARTMTSHVQFRRALVNRIWAELMGFGIVEPVDDFDLNRYDAKTTPAGWTVQPSNPVLLDAMAEDFRVNNHSFRHVIRTILNSSAYQLSSHFAGEWKEDYTPYYARKFVRMLSAAELHDSIALATGQPGKFSSGAEKVPMVQQMSEPKKVDGETQRFMRTFGQSNRDDMPKKIAASSLQAMLLMQSKVVTDRVQSSKGGLLPALLAKNSDNRTLVEQIYVHTVSRKPTAPELAVGLEALGGDRARGAENLQWALLNSPEFLFNY
ncbi:MAG: DUF1553 domain-containing protein [Acidobacteria bacterium]|nr:DUF1553 domain-containing protein [Acidobacteriota bacterium]